MIVTVCLTVALTLLIGGIALAVFVSYTKMPKKFPLPFQVFSVTVFLAGVALFVPMYAQQMAALGNDGLLYVLKVLLLSVHNTIRLFIVDGEFNIISDYFIENPAAPALQTVYTSVAVALFVTAPILTFSVILSLFRSAMAQVRYKMSLRSKIYIFSELNEQSLAVAKSLYEKDPKIRLVFTDVYRDDEETGSEYAAEAKKLKALLFKKDITAVNFYKKAENKAISFFLIGHDDAENLEQALWLYHRYLYRDHTHIYLFSTSPESELVFSSLRRDTDGGEAQRPVKVKLRRINEAQSLIYRNLYENGGRLFDNALPDGDVKKITAVVVGLGRYGENMTRALVWFCQMIGYRVVIHAFDKAPDMAERFTAQYPDLMNPDFNNDTLTDEDARYRIVLHPGVDVAGTSFSEALQALPDTTYVFVSLGDDERNIKTAVRIRQLFEGMRNRQGLLTDAAAKRFPPIQAVVYNSRKKEALTGVTNFRGEALDIDFIGDVESCYSEKVIIGSEIEQLALGRHTGLSKPEAEKREESFWRFEYNYRSSLASAIHKEMRRYCRLPGAEKDPEARDWETERLPLRMLEHRRWSAYMRSEGYTYAPVRNDLAKQHWYLVNFSDLSDEVTRWDDV